MQQISIRTQINKELDILPADLQRKVLSFITRLSKPKRKTGNDGEKLMKFAGILEKGEAAELMDIINTDCSRIDNEW